MGILIKSYCKSNTEHQISHKLFDPRRTVLEISDIVLGLEMGSQQGTLPEGSEGFLKYLWTLQFQANVHLEAVPKRFQPLVSAGDVRRKFFASFR